jgi:hypothetical protein
LDRSAYGFGDTVWYKAYTIIGSHHQLSALSGVLYVELINPNDSVVVRQTLRLISGTAWNGIAFPKSVTQGKYRIRAYTNWMRNYPDYFYSQAIQLGGIEPALDQPKSLKHPDVQFFPEGGQLVEGVRSRVAIKSIGSDGLGEDIKGTIEDNEGNKVADFSTQHLGMGLFALIPASGKTYTAKVNINGKASFTLDLPKAHKEGYTLAINNSDKDSIYIKVAVNEKTLDEQRNNMFYIVAQNNGKVYYTSQGKLEKLVYNAKIEKSRFPTGISQFTLISQNGEPLAERIIFTRNTDTVSLIVKPNIQTYTKRQKVKIDVIAKTNENNPSTGSFSVAVINESAAVEDENGEKTILNDLLLTSDLKGYVEQPNYYFINNNNREERMSNLDILMLTQGYHGFEWQQILNNPTFVYLPETSIELAGKLQTLSGVPVFNGKVTLVDSKDNLLKDTLTDQNGNFKFTGLSVIDTSTLVLRARKENNSSNIRILVNAAVYPPIKQEPYISSNLSHDTTGAIFKNRYLEYQQEQKQYYLNAGRKLDEVKIKGYKKPEQVDLYNSSNLNGKGNANQVIMGNKLSGCINLADCLKGKVFGVTFDVNGIPHNTRGATPPEMAVIVDGIIMPGTRLNDLSANDVYSIEVLRSASYLTIYGSSAPGGALVITTKRGGEGTAAKGKPQTTGIITFPFSGYSKIRTFYIPKYEHSADNQVDTRTTIYWNPNLITDENGSVSFSYLNNDTKGIYKIVIEGIDEYGNLGRYVYRYKVE